MRTDVGRHFLVQRLFPVHALGDRLDDQITASKQRQMLVIVRGVDVVGTIFSRERRRLEFLQILDRFLRNPVGVAFLRGEIEQNDRNAGIGKVRGDLRAHDTSAKYGDLAHEEMRFGHGDLPGLVRERGCTRRYDIIALSRMLQNIAPQDGPAARSTPLYCEQALT